MMQSTGSRITKIIESTIAGAPLSRLVKHLGWAGSLFTSMLGTRRSVLLPGVRLPGRPGLLLLTTLLLGLLCVVLTFRFRPASGSADEVVLLSDPSSSNLNNTSAAASAYTPASQTAVEPSSPDRGLSGSLPSKGPANQSADHAEAAAGNRSTETTDLQAPERLAAPRPETDSPPPAEFPRRLAAEKPFPSIPATELESAREKCYPVRSQGDTPMMRTWQMLGLKTLLAALFAATPGMSSETSGPPTDSERLTEIQKQLNALQNSLTEIKNGLTALEGFKTETNLAAQKVQNQIADLNRAISQLRSDVDSLRNRASDSNRIAAFPPSDTGINTATGRVDLINTYSQPVSIVLNNRRSYVLAPGERRLSDPIPAGGFTYEVLGVTPIVARTVAPEKVFTLWVHPQP